MTTKLLILTEGRFGEAVAASLASREPAAVIRGLCSALPTLDALVAEADFVAVGLWRRYPQACDAVDAACARHRVPWSSVTLDGRFLVAGPLIAPGGPCHACFRRRWFTHLPLPEREQALEAAYDADPALGPAGFLPGSVTFAAAALALDCAEAAVSAGRMRRLDLLSCNLEETRVVRVHGCQRCGDSLPRGDRYIHHLLRALRDQPP